MRQVKITKVQEKSQGPEKWKFTEIIVCYRDEYATDITDNSQQNHFAGSTTASPNQQITNNLVS